MSCKRKFRPAVAILHLQDRLERAMRGITGLFAATTLHFLLALVISGTPAAALADDPKPYGPITGDDFTQPAPVIRPKDKNGNPLKAEISTAIKLDPGISSTYETKTPGGAITIKTMAMPKVTTQMIKDKSWIEPALKNDTDLVDHEKGHLDTTEKNTRALQAELNKKQKDGAFTETKTLPPGTSDADRDKAIDEQEKRVQKKIDDLWAAKVIKAEKENEKYDDDTDHGKGKGQGAARKAQEAALKNPNTDSALKTGVDLKSKSKHSIMFSSSTGLLTIDEDFLIGIDPLKSTFVVDPADPVLGAMVVLPVFSLLGEQADGSFFFSAVGTAARLEIVRTGGEKLFVTDLAYLVYDPAINLLFGLGGAFEVLGGTSAYVNNLLSEVTGDNPALFGIEFLPNVDFAVASLGFTSDAIASFTNNAGARDLRLVPEPATSTLFALCLLVLGLTMRQRRKQANWKWPWNCNPASH